MLRMLVLLLLLANGLYFAWAQGHLTAWTQALGLLQAPAAPPPSGANQYAPLHPEAVEWVDGFRVAQATAAGAASAPQTEPAAAPLSEAQPELDALASPQADNPVQPAPLVQPEPEAAPERAHEPTPDLQASVAESPSTASAAAPVQEPVPVPVVPELPKQCMAIGPFSAEQMEPIRSVLQGLARHQWRIEGSPVSGRWMVFWGGANDELVLSARRGELQNKAIPHERLRSSPVGIGFSLGRFSSEAAAQQHKKDLERKGVRGTTVEVEREPSTLYTLEFPDYAAIKELLRRDLGRHFGTRPWRAC